MFLNLHQQQYQSQSHLFHLSTESQTSEEGDSSGGPTQKPASSSGDGGTIEAVPKLRGRPPGSKNKPKPPVMLTQEPEPVMSPYILEVPAGSDVVEALKRFSVRKNKGLCILSGKGTVANVTLRQPSSVASATTTTTAVTFYGRFDILSISATIFPNSSIPIPDGFSISVAGPQGQVVGGFVAGSLIAAGTVFLIALSFNNMSYHRLPSEVDVRNNNSVSGDGVVQSLPVSGGGGAENGHVQGESMYSGNLPSDVIWAPTAMPPPF
ncbi:hypothetical protein TanjilG_17738 [Lupinus angustifolius]|uniref:AT-hook motif nuclear-localized protein n=2 Tax=Lupinus angustifolius TaxID=3871 RepID=A0A1J7HUS6_LUPAN|nr:hypothetical protein TanjilG_17738 [Lupinus angustifolius]